MPTQETELLTDRIRRETRELHDSTEQNTFQSDLAGGRLSVVSYIKYLAQMFFIHKTLEDELRKQKSKDGSILDAIDEVQFAEPFLSQDLQYFSLTAQALGQVPATKQWVSKIGEESQKRPAALIGMHYVLLGSKHGGIMLAPSIQKIYKLDGGGGTTYLNPYGNAFAGHWKEFKEKLNATKFSKEQQEAILEGAKSMFLAVQQIGEDLKR